MHRTRFDDVSKACRSSSCLQAVRFCEKLCALQISGLTLVLTIFAVCLNARRMQAVTAPAPSAAPPDTLDAPALDCFNSGYKCGFAIYDNSVCSSRGSVHNMRPGIVLTATACCVFSGCSGALAEALLTPKTAQRGPALPLQLLQHHTHCQPYVQHQLYIPHCAQQLRSSP